jgi:hypothetical protein
MFRFAVRSEPTDDPALGVDAAPRAINVELCGDGLKSMTARARLGSGIGMESTLMQNPAQSRRNPIISGGQPLVTRQIGDGGANGDFGVRTSRHSGDAEGSVAIVLLPQHGSGIPGDRRRRSHRCRYSGEAALDLSRSIPG